MSKTICDYTRQFSKIRGLQEEHTLIYSLETTPEGECVISLRRTGAQACQVSRSVPVDPEAAACLLQFFCENAVQPELLEDMLENYCPKTPG